MVVQTGNKSSTSKIQCNRDYNPPPKKKKTVLAFAVGLQLSEDETIDLLKSAGDDFGFENLVNLIAVKNIIDF